MIRHLKNNAVDKIKYDACISNALNTNVWAYSWYLDIVSADWDCLVMGDYDIVMPIPYMRLKRNLYRKKIFQPSFCQQLGVFYREQITADVFDRFYAFFLSLNPIQYCLNSHNYTFLSSENKSISDRINFELSLNINYTQINKNFGSTLKRNIKKANKNNLSIDSDIDTKSIISMKKKFMRNQISNALFSKLKIIIDKCIALGIGQKYVVRHEEEIILAAFFIYTDKRIINLLSVSSQLGRKLGASHFMFDHIIQSHIETDMILDFEGSMIPGVAKYFKSYGAEAIKYSIFNK